MAQLSWADLYDLVGRHGARPGADLCACAAADAESGRRPEAVGDNGHSYGLWQLYDQGLGAGMTPEQRMDPDQAAAVMVPIFNQTYTDGIRDGYSGEDLVRYCCMYTEHPYGFPNLYGPAADRYVRAWHAAVAALTGEANGGGGSTDLAEAWIAAMEALTGTPYVFGGKDIGRDGGLDCSGLLTSTARQVGLDLGDPDYTSADGLKQYCDPITDLSTVRRGDVVLFSQTYGAGGPDYATHTGVWLQPGRMLDTHDGVHETNLYERYWQAHLMGFWRPRGLAGGGAGGDELSAEERAELENLRDYVGGLTEDVLKPGLATIEAAARGQKGKRWATVRDQVAAIRQGSGVTA